ncbi:MAG: PCRF domain-containing protein, partial [Clostridia bacterium]|nr:PCRF domain-containing protein [Clostridia bacterium]
MGTDFLEKTAQIEKRYEELSGMLADPEVISDQNRWRMLMKESADLAPIVDAVGRLRRAVEDEREAQDLLQDEDPEMHELARLQLAEAQESIEREELQIRRLLLPKDPNDEKNVMLE